MSPKRINAKERFIHRELSWLNFNERVLEEAQDKDNPLLERLKFLAIFIGNLDEFQMVRVAGIKNILKAGVSRRDRFGYYPQEIYSLIQEKIKELIEKLYRTYEKEALKELPKKEIYIKKYKDLSREQKKTVDNYFESILFPIITPMAVDQGHPFPALPSKTIAFALMLKRGNMEHMAVVPLPKNIPRLFRLPSASGEAFILIDEIIQKHLNVFFKGFKVQESCLFRLIRDSDITFEEDLTPNLLKSIEDEVTKRSKAKTVYLEVQKSCSDIFLEMLCERLEFNKEEVILIDTVLDLTFLFELYGNVDQPELKYRSYAPARFNYEDIFTRISEGDFIAHLPFQSFYPTVDLVESAAKDPGVMAIKMTLYRTNNDSAIIEALREAAKNGKQVTILVEIKARFDEENNIKWVRTLEEAGCHVIYGIPGIKVHSKMTLIVRREEGRIKRYVHLSTGNYNEKTAKVYTDIGYFTNNDDFARDISNLFNVVTGYSMPSQWQRIVSAPDNLRDYFYLLIDREIDMQKKKKNGKIWVKINSLEDPDMIDKLYEASQAGVKIQLIVRGICCLVPGVKGLSENIEVKSIVGRFLEHTRIFIFNNNNMPRVFLSSADWMRRNLDRRVELLFEIYKDDIKSHLLEIFQLYMKDNVKSRNLRPNRNYERSHPAQRAFNIQEYLIDHYSDAT